MSVFDESRSFETKNGFKLKSGAGFFSGPDSPLGTPATQGSLYLRTNNEIWQKIGPGDNDWVLKRFDPFEFALFSEHCELLFAKDDTGQVTLLEEC